MQTKLIIEILIAHYFFSGVVWRMRSHLAEVTHEVGSSSDPRIRRLVGFCLLLGVSLSVNRYMMQIHQPLIVPGTEQCHSVKLQSLITMSVVTFFRTEHKCHDVSCNLQITMYTYILVKKYCSVIDQLQLTGALTTVVTSLSLWWAIPCARLEEIPVLNTGRIPVCVIP